MSDKINSDKSLIQLLLDLSIKLEQQSSMYGVLDDVAETLDALVGFKSAWIFIATQDKDKYQLLSMRDKNLEVVPDEVQTLSVNGDQMLEELVATNRIVYVEDAEKDVRTNKKLVKLMKNKTIVNIPLCIGHHHLGILGTGSFGDQGIRKVTQEQLLFLETLAKHVAIAVDRIQLINSKKTAVHESHLLRNDLLNAKKLESVGSLAGGIAHDFNNLLYIMSMAIEMAKKTNDNEAKRMDFLTQAQRAGARGKALISQILRFSQHDEIEELLVPTDVVPIVEETVSFIRATFPSQIVINYTSTEAALDCKLATTHLSQIILNLTLNAKYAMKEKGGVLDIKLDIPKLDTNFCETHQLDQNSYFRLQINDTGTGISTEDLRRIFDPFFTTKPSGEGTGLGLSVVHDLVADHGGILLADSVPQKGTSFSLYLPIYDEMSRASSENKEKSVKAETETKKDSEPTPIAIAKTGRERILLIEDDLDVGELEKMMLESMRYSVTYCSSSLDGVALFKKRPMDFDLVITDYTMPNITGTEVAKQIIKVRSDIPIILLTGFSEAVDEKTALALGIVAYLMKPITALELSDTLRKIFNTRLKTAV